jgi:hypothetical protein
LKVRRVSLDDYGTNLKVCVGKRGETLIPIEVTNQWVTQALTITADAPWQFAMAMQGGGDPWGVVDDIHVDKVGMSNVAVLPGGFIVTAPPPAPPTITGIAPATGPNTGIVTVAIAGTGFRAGATAKLALAGQPDVPGANLVVASSTTITATFNLGGVTPGAWDVVVTNPIP